MDADATWLGLLAMMGGVAALWALLTGLVLLAERRSHALAVAVGWLGVALGFLGTWEAFGLFLGSPLRPW